MSNYYNNETIIELENKVTKLEQENAELKGMLKHLLEHDCINDHKLDREVEKLLNK